jgi:hypothetical protein
MLIKASAAHCQPAGSTIDQSDLGINNPGEHYIEAV